MATFASAQAQRLLKRASPLIARAFQTSGAIGPWHSPRMYFRLRWLPLVSCSLMLLAFGCGDGDVLPRLDAGEQTDPGPDDEEDASAEPDPGEDDADAATEDDAAVEPGMDAGPDASSDAAPDPAADAALDASTDAGTDAAADASGDAGPDPLDAATDSSSDAGPDPLDAAADASSDAGADALVDAASGADADAGDSNQDAAADAGSDADAAVAVTISFSTTSTRPLCNGGATGSISFVSASGGTPAYTYSINGGVSYQTSSTFSGLGAGTYQLAVKDAAGHVQTDSLILGEPAVLQITGVSSTDVRLACDGGGTRGGTAQATVAGGTAPHAFAWSPHDDLTGDGTRSVSGLPGSPTGITYTVNVTDANGCSAGPASVTIFDETADMVNYYGLYCFHAGIFDHFGLPEPVSFADCFTDDDAINANLFFMTWADQVAQTTTAVDAVAVTIAYLDGVGDTKYQTMLPITECLTGTPDYAALMTAANGQDVYSEGFLGVIVTYITANDVEYYQRFVAIDAEFDDDAPFSAGQLWGDFIELVSDDL
jgi:hypothetical protein